MSLGVPPFQAIIIMAFVKDKNSISKSNKKGQGNRVSNNQWPKELEIETEL